jgi:hypothetical protein
MFGGERAPEPRDLEALRRRLQAFFGGHDPAPPTRRELRSAAWILWNGHPKGAEIAGLEDTVWQAAAGSPRLIRTLIEAWLRDYAPEDPHARRGGLAIRRLIGGSGDASLERWRQADRAFSLFDAVRGVPRIAQALLADSRGVEEVWRSVGLDDEFRASGGCMRAILLALAGMLPEALRGAGAEERLERAFEAVAPAGTMRFGQELRGPIARGLLGAWLDGGPEPLVPLRDRVRDFLLAKLGDPRTRPAHWTPVGEEATALMRRWLTGATLDAFFDLIDEYALDHQWRYRKAFWSAYLERGFIEDAWLALGPAVRLAARTIRDLAGAYAQLDGAAGDPNQSVLLMRIGPLVLCEWSHNGKLRAWPRDWANAPALYQERYAREALRTQGLPFPPNPENGKGGAADGMGLIHGGSANGLWQGSAAELIARRAGIRLGREDWMPS